MKQSSSDYTTRGITNRNRIMFFSLAVSEKLPILIFLSESKKNAQYSSHSGHRNKSGSLITSRTDS